MPNVKISGIKAVILDIEGTVAPITFVKETLFPYALKALPGYLAQNWASKEFQEVLSTFPAEAQASPEALEEHVADLTASDVKVAYLKNLQGTLWRAGYKSGDLVTPLYDDVPAVLKQWSERQKLAIFSSGSVEAQKMFFGHVGSSAGEVQDLQSLFEPHWFDTVNAGPKFDSTSYKKIVAALNVGLEDALFLSDHIQEVRAALDGGLEAVLVVRPGNPAQPDDKNITVVHTLDEVDLE